jgi:thiol-disulfide isomerase/thioredoxin
MHRALWRVREFYANSELLGKSPSRIALVLCREVQRGKFLRDIAQVQRKEYDKVAKRRGAVSVSAVRYNPRRFTALARRKTGRVLRAVDVLYPTTYNPRGFAFTQGDVTMPRFRRIILALTALVAIFAGSELHAQNTPPPSNIEVLRALAQGDAAMRQRDYNKALAAYYQADKLSHHTCSVCLLRIVSILRKAGDFDGALDTAKKAIAAAGENKKLAAEAHAVRGSLLAAMANKPTDKKLKEAEQEFRNMLALQPELSVGHRYLGVVLIRQNRDTEGIAEMNAFINVPGNEAKSVAEARMIVANPIRAREPFAPDFSFTSLEGGEISSAALQGKVVLLDFWATWCPPCRESVPTMVGLHKKFAGRPFEILGISGDDEEGTVKTFTSKNGMNWTEFLDNSGTVSGTFDVDSFPTYIVVDKEGVIRYRQSGFGGTVGSELEDIINKALKRPFVAGQLTEKTGATGANAVPATTSRVAAQAQTAAPSPPIANALQNVPAATPSSETPAGGTYHNGALGFTYPYPKGWTPATAAEISAANAKIRETPSPTPAPGQPHTNTAAYAELLFYAHGPGKDDGTFHGVPSVKITSLESVGAMLNVDVMKRDSGDIVKTGLTSVRDPEKFSVNDQNLYRMDFKDTHTGQIWVAVIETIVYDHLLTIEIRAETPVQLDLLVATVKYSVFGDADKK